MRHPIISRYIIRETAGIFLLGLAVFTLILLMGKMVKLIEMVVTNNMPFLKVVQMILLLLPSFLVLTIPMAFLLAVLLTFGRLSSDNEITTLKACGISLASLLPPVLITATLAGCLTLVISLVIAPWGSKSFKHMTIDAARTYASTAIQERIFRYDIPNIILYVDHFDEHKQLMERIMIQDARNPERPLTIFAKNGVILTDDAKDSLKILLYSGSIHTSGKDGEYRLATFAEYQLTADLGLQTEPTLKEADMGLVELRQQGHNLELPVKSRVKALAEIHSRFAFPCAVFAFALLAIPLGLQNRRSGKSSGFTISIFILLTYYLLMTCLRTLAEKETIPVFAAVWLPNLLFTFAGAILLWFAVTEKPLKNLTIKSRGKR